MQNVGATKNETVGNLPKGNTLGVSEDLIAIQTILNNMYTNKALAVFREYTANAYDSHVRAGTEEPVRVSLPTRIQPTVEIEDQGVGLAPDEILPVFGTYGNSRSRESDEFVGGFGIGSKSAFTMGQQFIVTARKDGKESVTIFALDDHGAPGATTVSVRDTDQPNGVKISLSVDDVDEFTTTAWKSAKVWKPGTILLDDMAPKSIYEDADWITDKVFTSPSPNYRAKVYVVMGTVAYPVDDSILITIADASGNPVVRQVYEWNGSHDRDRDLYISLPIGAVDIAPSREALRDTKVTVTALQNALVEMADTMVNNVATEVTSAGSMYEAMTKWQAVSDSYEGFSLPAVMFDWQGVPLQNQVALDKTKMPDTDFDIFRVMTLENKTYRSVAKVVASRTHGTFQWDTLTKHNRHIMVVTVADTEEASKVTRFARGVLESGTFAIIVTTVAESTDFGWLEWGQPEGQGVKTLTFAEWREMLKERRKAARLANGTPEGPAYAFGHWSVDRYTDRDSLEDAVADGYTKVFIATEVAHHVPHRFRKDVLAQAQPVALLPTQKEDKFRERAEAAGIEVLTLDEVEAIVKEAADALAAAITDEERNAFSARSWLESRWSTIRRVEKYTEVFGDEITSRTFRDLADTIELANMEAEDISDDRYRELTNNFPYDFLKGEWDDVPLDQLYSLYPMLEQVSTYSLNHNDGLRADVLAYLNSK